MFVVLPPILQKGNSLGLYNLAMQQVPLFAKEGAGEISRSIDSPHGVK